MSTSTTSGRQVNLNYGTFPIRTESYGCAAGYPHPPLKSAAASAEAFRSAIRLTAADLLADPAFVRLARAAAEAGKRFTAELLEWERKPVVMAAVAEIRKVVDAERIKAAQLSAIAEAARLAKLDVERPTREAVEEAYESCGFRTCTQGHTTRVVVGLETSPRTHHTGIKLPTARADTHRGARYSSRCTFSRMLSSHTIYVRADYLTRTAPGGTTFGNRLVLDAEPVGAVTWDAATPVYQLIVARQAAGTGLTIENVRVALRSGEWVELPRKAAVDELPGWVLGDYLEDHGADVAVVDSVRAVGAV